METSRLRAIRVWAVRAALGAVLALIAAVGCGGDPSAQHIRDLRMSGNADSARTLAVAFLEEKAARMDVWLELTHSTLDLCRRATGENDRLTMRYVLEAGLTCGAIYQHRKRDPGRQWLEASKITASEVTRQINRIALTLNTQAADAGRLSEMARAPHEGDALTERARQDLDKMVGDARDLLRLAIVMRRLLESLPETSPGVTSLLTGQLEAAVVEWGRALGLDSRFTLSVQNSARQSFDDALARATGDLQDLGYLLPATLLENGVLP